MSNYKKLDKTENITTSYMIENINESNTVYNASIKENDVTFLSNIKNILLFIGEKAIFLSGIGIPHEDDD